MNHRIASALAYLGTVTAATLAAALMSGNTAMAEGPIEVMAPFVGTLSRAEVRAELMNKREQATSFASEWTLQQDPTAHAASGYTREQARADYIAAREQVHAMTAEDGGSSMLAHAPKRSGMTTVAGNGQR
jgi:hypothetical protein